MIINHNMSAIFAQNKLKITDKNIGKDVEKLSSGMRINRAGDDASGLAVSEKMRAQIRGLRQASKNAENGISFIQTTEGYLQETQDILHRMRELRCRAPTRIYTKRTGCRSQVEYPSSSMEWTDRSHAQFTGMNMLSGRFAQEMEEKNTEPLPMWIPLGANMDQRERVFLGTMTSSPLNTGKSETGRSTLILPPRKGRKRNLGLTDVGTPEAGQQTEGGSRSLPERLMRTR
jgi:flagellin